MAVYIKMKLGMEVGLGHILLDGTQLHPKRAEPPPIFSPCRSWPNGWMD